jgi:class 3 adenylate cyclase/tetratricopeptide (TPR) repeat protein
VIECPACGQQNPDGFRFCGACASPLDAAVGEPARAVRKTVTIVFCDLAGSTALADGSDPERVRTVMSHYHDIARRVLESHGATIEKFIGDAVMAVFGVPLVREDDTLRALRAVCELRDELAAAGIPVRIGVNTGEVVAGGGEALVTGDAVNVAARLEQAAGVGEVWIGDTTYRLTREAVHAEPIGGISAKGKPAPVEAHRLVSVSAHAQAIPRRIDSKLVGRTLELNMLSEAFERAVSERRCHLFTVMGTPGVGKSRLVAELAGGAASDANVLVGQCLPYGEGITFWPVAEMLRAIAGIGERDDREAARAALDRLVAEDEDGLLLADRVAQAIGLGGAQAPAEEVFWAIRRTFEVVAGRRPTVLVFEDVHWAEPTLLDLIEHVADWSRGCALLIVCTARPDLLDTRPGWAGGKTNATTIMLERLLDEDCTRLLEELAGELGLTTGQRQRVVAAAEGNPLFVEQMLAMLTEDGRDGADVPLSIQALLAARLDRLEIEERRVVESASVEGRVFHHSALAALSPDAARPALAAHLQRLMRRELIDPDRSLFEGDSAYRFQHVLIRDAAYGSLPKRARAELHERFAEWLEQRVAQRIDEYREILAFHLEQAYALLADVAPEDPRLDELRDQAVGALEAAARQAHERGDDRGAYAMYMRAASLRQEPTVEALDLLIEALRVGWVAAPTDELLEISGRARALAERLGDESRALHTRVLTLDAELMADTGFSTADAHSIAERAAARFEADDDPLRLFDALHAIATVFHHEGHWSPMNEALSQAERIARELGDARREQDSASARMGGLYWGDSPAKRGLLACAEMLERWPSSPLMRSRVLCFQARFLAMLGRFDEAHRDLAEWLRTAEQIGDRYGLNSRAFTTATIAAMENDLDTALSELAWSIEQLERAGQRGLVSTLYGLQGLFLARVGRWDEAAESAQRARERSHPDDLDSESLWRWAEAPVRAHEGDLDGAVALVREAIEIIDRSDETMFQANARMTLADMLESRGDADGARTALGEALDRYRAKQIIPSIAVAEQRLAALDVAK